MIIKLISTQIPQFWNIIKYGAVRADGVQKDNNEFYLNELLLDLLNDKAQCFIRLSPERIVRAVMVTRISYDKLTGKKYLFFQNLFSFSLVSDSEWQSDFIYMCKYAKQAECERVSFESSNNRIIELTTRLGCQESFRTLSFDLGGVNG
jgi:hypothetical protein